MARQANAVDFWRGYALIAIFINHVPGIYYSRFTHTNISISDSADLFVFLAGWALRYLVGSGERRMPTSHVMLRLGGRAVVLYAAQVLITMIAIAMLATSALLLNNPLLLEWHNASAVFNDPVPTHIGLAVLTHQLGYFDILPLYVVLMLAAPAIALLDRLAPNWVLPVSFAIYLATLSIPVTVPTWPVEGQWFFNPLAWQFVFVLGFVLARDQGIGGFARRNIVPIRVVSLLIVAAGLLVVWFNWYPDPTRVPQPRLLFIAGKTFVTPIRVIQFLALIAVVSAIFPYIQKAVPRIVNVLSMLGRNSLQVFCVGSLLSMLGQITRLLYRGAIAGDTVVVIVGVLILVLTAWLSEWRDHVGPLAAARPSALPVPPPSGS